MNREKLFESIINDSVQLIQVGDLETLSMIYANDTAKKFFPFAGGDCIGKPCYKYFMGNSTALFGLSATYFCAAFVLPIPASPENTATERYARARCR